MPELFPPVESIHPWVRVLLALALKGTILLGAAGLTTLLLRRASAAARHLIWLVALAGLVALPVLTAALPKWHLAVPVAARRQVPPPVAPAVPSGVAELSGVGVILTAPDPRLSRTAAPSTIVTADATQPASVGPVWFWAAGAILAIVPIAAALVSLRRLRRRCRPVAGGRAAVLLRELTRRLRLLRSVTLLQSPERSMPMTWGAWRPIVLLPATADSWPEERLRVVLLHELGHVRRWDCPTQVLAHLARALHWFNPLAWLAVAQVRAEQERACDDLVLRAGLDPADYAEHLLAVSAELPSRSLVAPVALAMGRRSKMERRLLSILDPRRERRPLPRGGIALALFAALALVLPLSSVRLHFQSSAVAAEERSPDTPAADAEPAKRVAEAETKIKAIYGKELDQSKLTEAAIRGLVAALQDPYSAYLPPREMKELQRQIQGSLSGIGAQLGESDGKLTVVTPLEDSPALKAGLRPGDVILAIDGKPTKNMKLSDAVRRIIGKPGTVVKLEVQHAKGGTEELAITRAQVKLRTVEGFRRDDAGHWSFRLDPGQEIGYLRIVQFGPTTAGEVRDTVKALQDKGLKGLVLDLRFCPGGLLSAGVKVCELFLVRGTIVTVKGLDDQEQVFKADGKTTLGDFPMIVLLNEYTASAGEIVAGALKENKRAVLVGTRSYGKGSVQQIITLNDGGALKLTSAHYYLPGGRNIQKRPGQKTWGVDPDDGYYVPLEGKQIKALQESMKERQVLGKGEAAAKGKVTPELLREHYADPQLAAALETMTAKLTGGSFIKVGKSDATLQAHLVQREEMQKRREALLKDLERVNRELATLDRAIATEQKEK